MSIVRYELDGTASECANVSRGEKLFPVGVRWSIEGTNILRLVRDSAAAARIDDYAGLDGELAAFVRSTGIHSTVGVPIVVAGRLWGTVVGSTTQPDPLPEDTASRLASFTELLATAIQNAKSREVLERLVDEQAALRRVATLVASDVRSAEIFGAVSNEVGRLVGTDWATVIRYDDDDDGEGILYVGSASKVNAAFPVGAHWKFQEGMASFGVYRTGRSARSGAHLITVGGPIGDIHRRLGIISAVASPIFVEGRLWGAMAVQSQQPLPLDTEERLEKFTELVATAIANADSKSELAASRRRIVEASDEARRRIERDLHDGTQQRLVVLILQLAALRNAAPGEVLVAELSRVQSELASALEELREMSRGIHPSILSEGGLGPALRGLARRSRVPVALDLATERRLAEPIEAAAYFVVSEALANATKHAQASRINVSLAPRDGVLLLSIRDDGIGGANSGQGSGLVGLHDRVEALGGTIRIESPPGAGTLLEVTLPLEVEPAG